MVLVVLSVLGVGIVATSANVLKVSSGERDDQSVYYIAEGGAAKVLSQINNEAVTLSKNATSETDFFNKLETYINNLNKRITFSEERSIKKPIANVKIEKINTGSSRKYRIISEGEIGNKKRKVEGTFYCELRGRKTRHINSCGNGCLYKKHA